MLNKGQLLIEIVLLVALLVVILMTIIRFMGVTSRSYKYQALNQGIALAGFEKYRNALISLSVSNWPLINSLTSTQTYYLYATSNDWFITTGSEKILVGNETYEFSFKIRDYDAPNVKFITTTAKYLDLILEDYFLLPKLNVSF